MFEGAEAVQTDGVVSELTSDGDGDGDGRALVDFTTTADECPARHRLMRA